MVEEDCRRILRSPQYAAKLKEMEPQVALWRHEWGMPELQVPTGEEVEAALFKWAPLVWYRLADPQDITLRLIAEWLLPGVPYRLYDEPESSYKQTTYIQGEIVQRLTRGAKDMFEEPKDGRQFHVFFSKFNPGVDKVVQELEKLSGEAFRSTSDPKRLRECDHMLVLLNSRTWMDGETSTAFTLELCKAMKMGVHRQLAHEVLGARRGDKEARSACFFESLITTTPEHREFSAP